MRRGPGIARLIAADPLDTLTSVFPAFLVQSSLLSLLISADFGYQD